MADIKISALPNVTAPASTDILPIVSGSTTSKITVSSLVSTALSTANISLGIGTSNPPASSPGYGLTTINGTTGGILSLSVGDTENFRIQSYATATNFVTSAPIIFKSPSVEWMRITATGAVGIGIAPTGTNLLQVNGEMAISNGGALRGSFGSSNTVSNLALGTGALGATVVSGNTAVANTAVGNNALNSLTTGSYNTALGYSSLLQSTTGTHNTALGALALEYNTTGNYNTGVGHLALQYNTTGQYNVGLGRFACLHNTTGNYNTGVGHSALFNTTTGLTINSTFTSGSGITSGGTGTNGTYTASLTWISGGYVGTAPIGTVTVASGAVTNFTTTASGATIDTSTLPIYTILKTAIGATGAPVNVTSSASSAIGSTTITVTSTTGLSTGMFLTKIGTIEITGLNSSMLNSITSFTSTTITLLYPLENAIGSGVALIFTPDSGVRIQPTLGSYTAGANNVCLGYNSGNAITTGSYNVILGSYTGSAAPISGSNSNYIVLSDGAGTVRQVIDAFGNVGIGTTSPGTYGKLAVVGPAGTPQIAFTDGTIVGTSGYISGSTVLFGSRSSNNIGFLVSDLIKGTIDSNGQVIFGNYLTASSFFPNADLIVSSTAGGIQKSEPHNIGIVGEGTGIPSVVAPTATGASSAFTIVVSSATGILVGQSVLGTGIGSGAVVTIISGTTITLSVANTGAVSGTITFSAFGIGVYGKGYTSGVSRSGGVVGEGHVSATGDTGSAIGIRGYSNDPHSGGFNIGLYSDATGSGTGNYALYMNTGNIYSAVAQTWTLNGNLTLSGAYTVTLPQLTVSAGTATVAPLQFTSGTNLTTAVAGAVEYDGSVFYADVKASTRGTLVTEQIMYLGTAYTMSNATGVQKLFSGSANGAVTLPVGDYQFECYATLSTLAASGTFGFALAGTATYTQSWQATGIRSAAGTASTASYSFNIAANTAITPTSTTTTGVMYIKGTLNVTVAGTVIPQFSQTVASTAVVGVGSYFKVSPLSGTSGTTNLAIGNWS